MNSFIKRRTIVRKVGSLPMLFISISVASSALLASVAAFADPISRPLQSKAVKQDDYFHTGAGARYLKRADADLVVESLRGNLTVLMGSGGNITVLSGKEGKFLVDAGISKSQEKLKTALEKCCAIEIRGQYPLALGPYRWQCVDACSRRHHRCAEEHPQAFD
jgi:hypothetical protein